MRGAKSVLALLGTLALSVVPSFSQTGEEDIDWGPVPGPTPGQQAKWEVEIFNIDDQMALTCNGNTIRVLSFGQRDRVKLDGCLHSGNNKIGIFANNNFGGYTYGMRIYRNGSVATSEQGNRAEYICGQAGSKGCNNDDKKTGLVFRKAYRIEKP